MAKRGWTRRFWVPVAVGTASAIGAAIGLIAAREQGAAHLDEESHQGKYTFGSADCEAGDEVDPVNIVFVGPAASSAAVKVHALLHGFWLSDEGSQQYFRDHGECQPVNDDQSASDGGLMPRYHMRYNEGDINGAPDWDAEWGYYALAAAHHEDVVWCGWTPPFLGHAVDGNDPNNPWSTGGFNMGKYEVYDRWVVNGDDGHELVDVKDWGNALPFTQCDGEDAWSNGIVYYISMPAPPSSGGGGSGCGRAIPCV